MTTATVPEERISIKNFDTLFQKSVIFEKIKK